MTPNAMVNMIKARLANSNDSTLDSLIIDVANLVQERLEQSQELPWFLFADTNVDGTNLTTVASTETVALPADFIREDEENEYVLFVQDTTAADTWVPLIRESYNKAKALRTGEGRPEYYEILGTNLYLRYIPDAAYTLRLLYFKRDDDIVAGTTENLWMKYAADWVLAETGLIMASDYVVMPAIAQHFREEAQRAQMHTYRETVARQEAGYMRSMGED